MSRSYFATRCKQVLLAALCLSCAVLGAAAHADSRRDDDRGARHYEQRRHGKDWDSRRHHGRHDRDDDRKHRHRSDYRHDHRGDSRYVRRDWHYHNGRYWAPPRYRGQYCDDHRHYRGAHYHVAMRDYYDYYYPRYRPVYPGPRHYDANATLIITLPLF